MNTCLYIPHTKIANSLKQSSSLGIRSSGCCDQNRAFFSLIFVAAQDQF